MLYKSTGLNKTSKSLHDKFTGIVLKFEKRLLRVKTTFCPFSLSSWIALLNLPL